MSALVAVSVALAGVGALSKGGFFTWVRRVLNRANPSHTGHVHVDSLQCPFSLHDAKASRFMAVREIGLLEQHLTEAVCPECITKHCLQASAQFDEASRLAGGSPSDIENAVAVEGIRRQFSDAYAENKGLQHLLEPLRKIRKKTMKGLGLVKHSHDDHKHD